MTMTLPFRICCVAVSQLLSHPTAPPPTALYPPLPHTHTHTHTSPPQKQEWAEVGSIGDLSKRAQALRWGHDARSMLVGSGDHNLRLYTAPAAAADAKE